MGYGGTILIPWSPHGDVISFNNDILTSEVYIESDVMGRQLRMMGM
jgi:hypothetical protein